MRYDLTLPNIVNKPHVIQVVWLDALAEWVHPTDDPKRLAILAELRAFEQVGVVTKFESDHNRIDVTAVMRFAIQQYIKTRIPVDHYVAERYRSQDVSFQAAKKKILEERIAVAKVLLEAAIPIGLARLNKEDGRVVLGNETVTIEMPDVARLQAIVYELCLMLRETAKKDRLYTDDHERMLRTATLAENVLEEPEMGVIQIGEGDAGEAVVPVDKKIMDELGQIKADLNNLRTSFNTRPHLPGADLLPLIPAPSDPSPSEE